MRQKSNIAKLMVMTVRIFSHERDSSDSSVTVPNHNCHYENHCGTWLFRESVTEVTVFTTSKEILENFICVKIRDIKIIKKTKEMQKTVTTVTKTLRSLDTYSFLAVTVCCDYCHKIIIKRSINYYE